MKFYKLIMSSVLFSFFHCFLLLIVLTTFLFSVRQSDLFLYSGLIYDRWCLSEFYIFGSIQFSVSYLLLYGTFTISFQSYRLDHSFICSLVPYFLL